MWFMSILTNKYKKAKAIEVFMRKHIYFVYNICKRIRNEIQNIVTFALYM